MSLKLTSYKGTRDLYPSDMALRNYIFDGWRQVVESYGYEEYENYILFKTGLGRKSKFVPGLTNYLGSYPHE